MMKAICILIIILLAGCGKKTDTVIKEPETQDIMVNKRQFEAEKMQIGAPVLHSFEDVIHANGYIISPSNGMAQVYTHVGGLIRSINLQVGDYVKKGQILCSIESKEIIQFQQDFIESANALKKLKADYERMKALNNENITSQKDFMTAESEYKAMSARYQGLKERLILLHLNPSYMEVGNIDPSIQVHAPISGFITAQYCYLGQYADPQKVLMEIVDVNRLQLQMFVFEKDIPDLKKGQLIRFYNPYRKDKVYQATLRLIGKSVNPETKTVPCIATIMNGSRDLLINGMYIESELVIKKRQAKSIPSEAVMKSGDKYFILVKNKEDKDQYYFRKLEVGIGSTTGDYSELIYKQPLPGILVKGGYNLQKE